MSKTASTAVAMAVALTIGCKQAPETGNNVRQALAQANIQSVEVAVVGLNDRTAGNLDGKIQDVLNHALDADPVLNERDVNFEVHNGMVAIKGSVRTADEKNRVGQIAKVAPGVKDVANGLEIRPE